MTDADVFRVALTLPETTSDTSSVMVCGKGFAWFWQERVVPKQPRAERRDVLVVRVADEGEKQALLASDGETFFTEPHYNGYPAVFVRLAALDEGELTELLTEAWRTRAPKKLVAAYDREAC